MTETIYEKRPAATPEKRQLPNNRRQIGQPGMDSPEVFIEDYAFSYAKSLSERDYTGCVVGVLVGEYVESSQGADFRYSSSARSTVSLRTFPTVSMFPTASTVTFQRT